ncbi:hypothetical protein H9P43_007066 [Blastocladiella emersonii ATCC 22665]|nr:hypothetical protein H9P43_007066 [Blastocladiella emersonii ATCC 22665]
MSRAFKLLVDAPYTRFLDGAAKKLKYPVISSAAVAGSYVAAMRPADFAGKTVIDINAGVGALATALVDHATHRPAHIVAIDPSEPLAQYLRSPDSLLGRAVATHGTRLTVGEQDHMNLSFFNDLLSPKYLGAGEGKVEPDPSLVTPWDADDAKVTAVVCLSTKLGDMNTTHLLRWMGDRAGIHSFGRVPLYLFTPRAVSRRLTAQPGDTLRGRVAALTQTLAKVEVIAEHHERDIFPFKVEMDLLRLEPLKESPLKTATLLEYEYALRTLFVHKKRKVGTALRALDPTDGTLAKRIPRSLRDVLINDCSNEQLAAIADAFSAWPLKMEFHADRIFTVAD